MADSTIDNLIEAFATDISDTDLIIWWDGTNPPKKLTRAELVKGLFGTGVQGDILYHNGTTWSRLAKGTASQKLQMNAGATAPEWVDLTATTSEWEFVENIWDFATDSNLGTTPFESSAFADGYEYGIRIHNLALAAASSTYIEVGIYKETSAAWHASYGQVTAASSSTTNDFNGFCELRGSRQSTGIKMALSHVHLGSDIVTEGTDDMGSYVSPAGATVFWSLAVNQKIGKIRVKASSGGTSFNAGVISLWRKAL